MITLFSRITMPKILLEVFNFASIKKISTFRCRRYQSPHLESQLGQIFFYLFEIFLIDNSNLIIYLKLILKDMKAPFKIQCSRLGLPKIIMPEPNSPEEYLSLRSSLI